MNYILTTRKILTLFVILVSASCGGSSTSSDTDFSDTTFVADGSSVGRLEVNVVDDDFGVGDTSGFFAKVFDSDGAPVQSARVVCDSELGVSIVEPTTGYENTSSAGEMSGIIGCAAPGSFQFGCRLPNGVGLRQFVNIKCRGPVPQGFAGFPDAAGGNLGGGVLPPSAGGPGAGDDDQELDIRITNLTLNTVGGADTKFVDIFFTRDCDGDAKTVDPENFSEDFISITVRNESSSLVRFTEYEYTVPNASGNGQSVTSGRIALTNELETAEGSTGTVQALMFDAVSVGSGTGRFGTKGIPGQGLVSEGIKNISVRLFGSTPEGREVVLRASFAVSFDNYNNC
jgi:hypothetical protein